MRLHPGNPAELVRIDLLFSDETFHITDAVTRFEAEWTLRSIGEYGNQPIPGKRVVSALIVPVGLA